MRVLLSALLLVSLAACQEAPTETVDDPLPTGAVADDPAGPTPADIPTQPTVSEIESMGDVPTEPMAEDMPEAAPEVVARGAFSGVGGHDVSGEAVLYRLDDGSHLVRLEGFETDNGPDLKVWLVRTTTGDVGANAASLGALKSTNGNQNYPVPAGVDVSDYAGVSIWCERFSVNFGTAPLG